MVASAREPRSVRLVGRFGCGGGTPDRRQRQTVRVGRGEVGRPAEVSEKADRDHAEGSGAGLSDVEARRHDFIAEHRLTPVLTRLGRLDVADRREAGLTQHVVPNADRAWYCKSLIPSTPLECVEPEVTRADPEDVSHLVGEDFGGPVGVLDQLYVCLVEFDAPIGGKIVAEHHRVPIFVAGCR